MTLGADVKEEEIITSKDDLSGADIKAVCTEAGLLALRERRMKIINKNKIAHKYNPSGTS